MNRTRIQVTIVALVALLLGSITLWIATGFVGSLNVVISTVGTVIITIGISNSVLDYLLRNSVALDLMAYVETDRRIIDSGLDGLETFQGLAWDAVFSDGPKIRCYMNNPTQFKEIVWPKLLEAAKEKPRQIDLAFVNPVGKGVKVVAQRLGDGHEHYVESLQRIIFAIEAEWKASENMRHNRSDLVIRTTDEPAHYSYAVGKERIALVLDPIMRSTGHTTTRVLVLRTDRNQGKSAEWLIQEIEALEKQFKAPRYSDRPEETDALGELD